MMTTQTGNFPIGFRRGWSAWQKDLSTLISFAAENGFAAIDLPAATPAEVDQVKAAGLQVGTIDLPQPWRDLASSDAGKRHAAAEKMSEEIRQLTELGQRLFFAVVIPEDHAAPRKDNLEHAAAGYRALCERLEGTGAQILLEGYPGGPPHYSSLACTPADYRLFWERVDSDAIGINYDPSHLIRMGIDPVRFLDEFIERVGHVHAKDTQLPADGLYEHGNLQPATLAKPHDFGGQHWRYTIPGHGVAPWDVLFRVLADAGYDGLVSIELEDERFNGTDDGERRGLIASRDFLRYA